MISQETLKSILEYDKDTGNFVWRISSRGHARAGNIAGTAQANADLRTRIIDTLFRHGIDGRKRQGEIADAVLAELRAVPQPQAGPVAVAVPEPAFRLKFRNGAYYVTEPKIGDTDCYTREQVEALLSAAPQPQPQASAEDVAMVDVAATYMLPEYRAAWQRIRAALMAMVESEKGEGDE